MDLLDFLAVWMSILYAPVVLLFATVMILHTTIVILTRKSLNKPVPAAWRAIIDITLIGGLKSETTENGKKRYFLFGYPVTPVYVRSVGLFTMALWQSLLVTFWLNFIIEVTDECKNYNGIYCFRAFSNSKIKDCHDIDSFNDSIHCYEFQFDFINGAGTAGGVLAIAITLLYGQLTAQMWLKKKISERSQHKRCFKASTYLLGVVSFVVATIVLLLGVYKFFEPIRFGTFRYTALPKYINTVFYIVPLQVISIYPLCKKTRLSTDPEEDSPGPDSYTLMEDGHESTNDNYTEEPLMRTRAHTTI